MSFKAAFGWTFTKSLMRFRSDIPSLMGFNSRPKLYPLCPNYTTLYFKKQTDINEFYIDSIVKGTDRILDEIKAIRKSHL